MMITIFDSLIGLDAVHPQFSPPRCDGKMILVGVTDPITILESTV